MQLGNLLHGYGKSIRISSEFHDQARLTLLSHFLCFSRESGTYTQLATCIIDLHRRSTRERGNCLPLTSSDMHNSMIIGNKTPHPIHRINMTTLFLRWMKKISHSSSAWWMIWCEKKYELLKNSETSLCSQNGHKTAKHNTNKKIKFWDRRTKPQPPQSNCIFWEL